MKTRWHKFQSYNKTTWPDVGKPVRCLNEFSEEYEFLLILLDDASWDCPELKMGLPHYMVQFWAEPTDKQMKRFSET